MFTDGAVVTPNGLHLAVRDYGGRGRPLLLIHGLSSNVCIWDLVGPRVAETHRVVAYDQRTHGESDEGDGDYSFPTLAADAAAVGESLGLDDPVVVGHSWGATVALHYAATHPCAGVVCVDGGIHDLQGMGMDWDETYRRLMPPIIEGPADEVLARIKAATPEQVPWEAAEHVIRRSFPIGEDGIMRRRTPIRQHMKIVRSMWEESLWDVHARVTCPVLAVLANRARAASVEELHKRKDIRVEWLDSVHDVPLAHPNELAGLISDFVGAL